MRHALNEDAIRARAYDLTDPQERARLLHETYGYMNVSRNDGTDRPGRAFALEALQKLIAEGWTLTPPSKGSGQ